MTLMKLTILAGAAAMAVVGAGSHAETTGLFNDGMAGSSTSNGSSTSTSSSSGGSSSGGTPVPEPSNLLMLALGVAGLVAGRYAARKKRDRF